MTEEKNVANETLEFKAETRQLLNILIHSLYTEREIFLRELVSNASDAISRLNFEQLTSKEIFDGETAGKIHIKFDQEAGTLTVSDTGIGMNRRELQENLGTIAHSGARAFLDAAKETRDADLSNIIGQFGVGFYSAFMVAEKIEVTSRSFRPDDEAVRWISDGGDTYEITSAEKEGRGTDVVIHLKEDAHEFLEDFRLRQIIKRHSDYVPHPIYIQNNEEQVNRQTAIWRQPPHQVKAEEYTEFYKQFTLDFSDPMEYLHLSVDAPIQLYALLYIPNSPEPNVFSDRKDYGLKLYARKILIQEYTRELLPEFLRFMQGVVDSEDLPLNVSRESFQATKAIAQIKKILTSKVLDRISKLAEDDKEKYENFWKEFGFFVKEGIATDFEHFDQLVPLLRFNTSKNPTELLSFKDYVERMQKDQKKIYYILGEDKDTVINSPHLEALNRRDLDVLLLHQPVDPFMLMKMVKYEDFDLVNVTSKDLDLPELPEDEKKPEEKLEAPENLNEVLTFFKTTLGDKVKEVRTTEKLVESPARLVDSEDSPSQEIQKAYRYLQKEMPDQKKILEINPHHAIIIELSKLQGVDPMREIIIEQVYENTLLAEGIQPDTAAMIKRINRIMEKAIKKD